MMISDLLLEQIIEGALMASGHPLSVERIQALFDEADVPAKDRIENALQRLGERCEARGYELKKVATGYRFQVKEQTVKWVSRLWDEKPQRYSRALLETLSIIAYRQPVTRGEIEDIRGVAVSSHITKTLLEREWVQVVGHRDVPGRPAMYATTKMFLDYFNMESLEQLPTLEEIQEIADANHALELEDKTEEGNYDLSHTDNESESEAAMESAAEDMAAAEAIVDQVEYNVFVKPEEERAEAEAQAAEEAEQEAILEAEQKASEPKSIADLADAIGAHQDKQKLSTDEVNEVAAEGELRDAEDALHNAIVQEQALAPSEPEMSEEDQAALIAKMLADQQALLSEKEEADSQTAEENLAESNNTNVEEEATSNEGSIVDADNDLEDAPSVFSNMASRFENNEEDTLQAAMEEEAAALLEEERERELLEAEQEELLALQEAEQSASQSMANNAESDGEQSLSDLANKFTTELD